MGVACEHRARLVSPIVRRLWRLYMGTQGLPRCPGVPWQRPYPGGHLERPARGRLGVRGVGVRYGPRQKARDPDKDGSHYRVPLQNLVEVSTFLEP